MFDYFIVLALEQLALAVVEEQWCDHMVQFYPCFITRMLLRGKTEVTERGCKIKC